MQKFRPHRYQTAFPIVMQGRTGRVQATVRDVNVTGMRITGVHGLSVGETLSTDVMARPVKGIVQWVRSDAAGIAFRPHILPEQADALRYALRHGQAMRYSSAGLREMR